MGTVFPFSQLLCELGPLELCQREFPCHLPGTSGFWLLCMLQAGSFSSFFSTGAYGSFVCLKNLQLSGKYCWEIAEPLGCVGASVGALTFPTAKWWAPTESWRFWAWPGVQVLPGACQVLVSTKRLFQFISVRLLQNRCNFWPVLGQEGCGSSEGHQVVLG